MTSIPLDAAELERHLEQTALALGVVLERFEERSATASGRVHFTTITLAKLPEPTPIQARFVHEGLFERAKKWFAHELEVGASEFDERIYVATSTREETALLLAVPRVRKALLALVDVTSHVEITGDEVRLFDEDVPSRYDVAAAELLAIAAHLTTQEEPP